MNEESNKIASNALVQIIGRVFVLALSLVSIKLITNYLGPAGTGYYNTVITYLSFVIVIADFGLFSVVVREVSKDPSSHKKFFANIFTIRFVSAITVTAIAVFIARFTNYPPEIKTGVFIASLFPIFNLAGSVYDMFFQYKLEMKKVVYAEVITKFIIVGLILIISRIDAGYFAIVATVSLSAILIFIIKAIYSKKRLPLIFSYDKAIIKQILVMSLPLGVVFIVNNIYFKVDTLILFYFKGATDVGIYAVSYRVLETMLFAGSYLSSSMKPLLSRSVNEDKEMAGKAVSYGVIYLLWMSLAIAIVCLLFPREIIIFLSNADFAGGAKALMMLGVATILIYISGIFGEVLIAKDLRKAMIIVSGCVLVFNVSLNIFLIPRYSYNGAALSTLISEVLLLSASYLVAKRAIDIKLDLFKIIKLVLIAVISIIFGVIIESFSLNFIFSLILVLALYFVLTYIFNAIPKQSLNNYLNSLKNKWTK